MSILTEALENATSEAPRRSKLQSVKFFVMQVCLVLCFKTVRCFIWGFDHPRTSLGLVVLFIASIVALVTGIGLFA